MTQSWSVSFRERLDAFLRRELPPLFPAGALVSNSKLRRLIIAGCVVVDGRECRRPAFELRPGSRMTVRIDEEKFFYEKACGDVAFTLEKPDVLYEDEFLVVVNKPPFLPSEGTVVQGRGSLHQAVVDYLWRQNPTLRNPPYVGIMHRLDRETSGALLFTKTRQVNKAVHEAFEEHLVRKCYRAVSAYGLGEGKASLDGQGAAFAASLPHSFFVDDCIGRVSSRSQACRMGELSQDAGGLHAHTDFTLVQRQERGGMRLYYLDCILKTGRTHQIRLHLSLSGLPIVGDRLYGGAEGFRENGGRIMLHAWTLGFPHPVTGKQISCEAPLPPLFAPGD